MAYYNGRADFEGNLRHIFNYQTNLATVVGYINQSASAGLIASQGDVNVVLAEVGALKARPAFVSPYVMAEGGDGTIYALNTDTGKLRAVSLAEWNVAVAMGHKVSRVAPAVITAAPKAA